MSGHHIGASWDQLAIQASGTATGYLNKALRDTEDLPKAVDRTAVIVALIEASSRDFHSAALGVAAQKISGSIYDAISSIASND